MTRLQRFKAGLARLLAEFGSVTTDKGVLAWDGEEDLAEGMEVKVVEQDGSTAAASDGDYTTEDGKVIVVTDGKVAEIKDAAAEVAPTNENFAEITTDNGVLAYEGEGDLKEGDEVFVQDENGERTPAPDGDYKTEDGKIIKVVEGKVAEIVDDEAEVATQDDVKARRMSRFTKIKEAFEASFREKEMKIHEAIGKALGHGNYYIADCGDDFGVADTWDDEYVFKGYFRYAISWNEDGTATASNPVEVRQMFVPMDMPSPFENKEEVETLKKENETLKAQVEKMQKMSAAKPAHEEVNASVKAASTGNKRLDNLRRILTAK